MEILLNVKESANAMSVTPDWIYHAIQAGLINPLKVGNKNLIPTEQLISIARDYQGLQLRTIEDMVIAKRIVDRRGK